MDKKPKPQEIILKTGLAPEIRLYFRDELRNAITTAQHDAEGFQEILFTVERLGVTISGKILDLGKYKNCLVEFVGRESVREALTKDLAQWHLPFTELYDLVKDARNEAFHNGDVARHITRNAIRLALVLEDALMSDAKYVREFMVRDPVCAYLWQPVSLVKQRMQMNNFTFMPIYDDRPETPGWNLLADYFVASYLQKATTKDERKMLLARTIQEASLTGELKFEPAKTCYQNQPIQDLIPGFSHIPFLVVDEAKPETLIGILTPFDLL